MKKSINVAKEINMILVNEDMELDAKSQLIQIKKILEYGENNWVDDDEESIAKALTIIEDANNK
ncbi:MAG: hypothetical protein RR538_09435 [Erysipelotrichaceae bacterium]